MLGIVSTPATTASRVCEIEIDKRSQDVAVFFEPCPSLARDIEADAPEAELKAAVEAHIAALRSARRRRSAVPR